MIIIIAMTLFYLCPYNYCPIKLANLFKLYLVLLATMKILIING